jgi:hypothetical protein
VADQQQNGDSKALTDIELERLKMYHDSFKHMMTFCSGAILLASAVTGALFLPKPELPLMLAFSIGLLAFGALLAMLGLVQVSRYMDSAAKSSIEVPDVPPAHRPIPPSMTVEKVLWVSVGAGYGGVALFSTFATTNIIP